MMPRVLFIWNMARFELETIIIQRNPIQSIIWSTFEDALFFCCGNQCIYKWNADQCFVFLSSHYDFKIAELVALKKE